MQISATGISDSCQHQSQRGFTLLEVLVVLFIIGLTTSLAVISMTRDDQSQVDQQARQLLEDFTFARDLALNRHRLVGWQVNQQGYQFALRDSLGLWQIHVSRGLPQREWASGLQLQGMDVTTEPRDKNLAPAVVFFPAGEVTPLTLTLKVGDAQRRIRIHASHFELLDLADES